MQVLSAMDPANAMKRFWKIWRRSSEMYANLSECLLKRTSSMPSSPSPIIAEVCPRCKSPSPQKKSTPETSKARLKNFTAGIKPTAKSSKDWILYGDASESLMFQGKSDENFDGVADDPMPQAIDEPED